MFQIQNQFVPKTLNINTKSHAGKYGLIPEMNVEIHINSVFQQLM